MRIHEVLEACIEYIAIDGVIGCHPSALQSHLAKNDPTIDDDAFVYIYTLLITHPSVRVVLATYPLPTPEGKYLLGTAPLPDDFNPPDATLADVDISAMYREGVRGRQLAYHLAGEEYLTSKQAIEEKKVQQLKARLEGKKLAKGKGKAESRNRDGEETPLVDADEVKTEESDLITYVDTDDGGQGEDKVLKSDLRGLTAKWGSRLRLRCTDEEIYFRLTGSHQKIPKITPVVFHILQLAARSREKGITAIELGPLVGASQGSMHYYMKVLLALGLCAKVPAVIHASITNLLLFHRFLDQNENYRAITKRAPFAGPSTELSSSAKGKERAEDVAEEEEDEVGEENDAGLDFGPLTEHELMAGHVVKERLTRVLDSPSLKNHLLRSKNLLAILGWKDVIYVRLRRALRRHITSLVIEGTIESLEVGPRAIRCLRLTKYNPDYRHDSKPLIEPGPSRQVVSQRTAEEYATPFHPLGGVSMVMSIEHMVLKGVIDSGVHGLSIAEIKDQLCDLYKRSVDFMVARVEDVTLPPHLRLFAVCTAMESVGKERRLRLFGIAAYREVMLSQGQTVSDKMHPPTPPEAGRWADLSFRRFYDSQADLVAFVDQYVHGEDDVGSGSGAVKAKAKGLKKNLGTKRGPREGRDGADELPRVPPSKRDFLYSNEVQTRGRPRKYIYVVDEQGKPNRRVIGQVLPDPALAPVWIYFSAPNKLVEAPPGYSGVGDVPEMTPAQMKAGKPPEWFDKFPKFLNETQKAKEARRVKTQAKGKGKGKAKGKEQGKSPGKRKGKRTRDEGVALDHEGDGEDGRRKSKRTRKETSYKERPDVADSEESDEEILPIEVDGTESTGGPGPSTEALRAVAENQLEAQPSPAAIDEEVQEVAPPTPQPKKRGRPRKDAVVEPTAATSKTTRRGKSPLPEAEPLPVEVLSAPEEVLPSAGDAFDAIAEKQPSVERIDETATSVTDTPRSSKRARKKTVPEPINVQPTETPRSVTRRPGAATQRSPTPVSAIALPSTPLFSMPRDSSPETSPFLLPAEFTKVKGKAKKAKSKLVEETKLEPQEGPESPLPSSAKSVVPMTEAAVVAPQHDAQPSVEPTPAVERDIAAEGADRDAATPLREIAGPTFPSSPVVTTSGDTRTRTGSVLQMPKPQDTPQSSRSGRVGRVDLGMIRKMNEVCQTLLEAGGVLTEMKLQIEHREWTARVAGTDAPSAPAVQYNMDRTFYRRTIALLIADGRLKSTKAAVPTPTGRWVQTEVLYLSTLPQEDVQAYIRTLASQTAQAMATIGKRRTATRIADANFSEVRVATPVRSASALTKPAQMPTEDLDAVRRETLLKEPMIVAYLYGFKSGRWARARSLHTGIIQAMRNSLGATSIISTSPRIFALPLLFEELSAGTFFECVLTSAHDEELEKWLRDPAKRQTKLKDMPKHLSPRGGFGSAAVKNKISGLLEAMCELKLLTPLNIEDPDRATLHVHSDALGTDLHFGGADGFGVSAYYIAHEHAPVYHIASDVSGLLGILPLREDQEIEAYWRAAQAACTEPDINMVEELDCNGPTTWPNTAPLTEVLELDVDLRKMLRAPVRWKHQIRLLPIQRRALDEAIDFRRGERIVTSRDEVEKLAYDNALPVEFVEAQLDARARQAMTRLEKRRETDKVDRAQYRQKQERAKAQLQQKLEERRATARAAWECKIKHAAENAGIEFSQELSDFVRRQTLQATNRVELNDEAVLEAVRLFKRTKEMGTGMLGVPTGTLPRLPPAPKFRKHQRRVPATKVVIPKGTRRRREWSNEDYELLLDAEAIITARAASRRGLGRSAMAQLFPNVSGQTFLNRVKKVLAEPGKQAYFDRLVPAWKDLWERYRGTPELPDEHPESTIEFDIKAHVKFLREKLNKNDLRSAYVGDTSTSTGSAGGRMINLPETVDELIKDHRVEKRHVQKYNFEAFHDSVVSEDHRVASLALVPLVETRAEAPRTLSGKVTRSQGVLSASIKMIVATPSEVYDQPLGMEMLKPWTDREQKAEISRLVEEKILLFVKSAAHTGRFYVFSQGWLQLCDGPFPQDLFTEAESASKRFDDPGEDGVEWPIVGTSGDIASLLNLVSSQEVDFGFDVDDFPTLQRSRETYNTRKLNDDSFEFKITVKLNQEVVTPAKIVPDPFARMSPTPWPATRQPQPRGLRDVEDKVISAVIGAGPDGIAKPDLLDVIDCVPETFDAALASLSRETAKRVFWTGYDTARLVATEHASAWLTATRPRKLDESGRVIRDLPAVPTRPRRWITINGELLHDEWDKAVRCVSGHLLARPGISERSLRAKLSVVYDRLELNEILQSLLSRGVARRAWTTEEESGERVLPPVEATDVDEEQGVSWWPARGMVLA